MFRTWFYRPGWDFWGNKVDIPTVSTIHATQEAAKRDAETTSYRATVFDVDTHTVILSYQSPRANLIPRRS